MTEPADMDRRRKLYWLTSPSFFSKLDNTRGTSSRKAQDVASESPHLSSLYQVVVRGFDDALTLAGSVENHAQEKEK